MSSLTSSEPSSYTMNLFDQQKKDFERQISDLQSDLNGAKESNAQLEINKAELAKQVEKFLKEKEELNRINVDIRNRLVEQENVNRQG